MFGGEATSSAAGRSCIPGALFQIKWGLRGFPAIDTYPQEDVTVPLAHLAGVSVAA